MKESIHQEFERFMRDEMDDSEREKYIKSKTKSLKKNVSLKEAEDIIKKFSNSEENKNKDTEKINKKPKSKKKK